ncbi:hypothetical protein [Methylomagnum ishizawai]|uniref:hypothetical protein n=1 Tax=Methylomagnum ishizawai TaxID=1760988 RepID=UPI001C320656|nr:hypothetical protein [Methylomagnum ishizawai]BBL75057.1 hypothetical protein MishRS11D_21550 [Methylomagnum ishizawai]
MNAPLKPEACPQSACNLSDRDRLAEFERLLDFKKLSQKLFEAEPCVSAERFNHYYLICIILERAEGVARFMREAFMEMDGRQHVGMSPHSVGFTAETLERDIRQARVLVDDYRERHGFRDTTATREGA